MVTESVRIRILSVKSVLSVYPALSIEKSDENYGEYKRDIYG